MVDDLEDWQCRLKVPRYIDSTALWGWHSPRATVFLGQTSEEKFCEEASLLFADEHVFFL